MMKRSDKTRVLLEVADCLFASMYVSNYLHTESKSIKISVFHGEFLKNNRLAFGPFEVASIKMRRGGTAPPERVTLGGRVMSQKLSEIREAREYH